MPKILLQFITIGISDICIYCTCLINYSIKKYIFVLILHWLYIIIIIKNNKLYVSEKEGLELLVMLGIILVVF